MENEPKKHIILVVGSGRSGTSMLTEVLTKAGCHIGSELVEKNRFNERGYFENRVFVDLHKRILTDLGRGGLAGSAVPRPAGTELKTYRPELKLALKRFAAESPGPVVAVKDPRISLLIPLWSWAAESLGFKLSVILSYRRPGAIIDSIMESNGCSRTLAEGVFVERTCAVLANTKHDLHFFDYDKCLESPEVAMQKLLKALDLTCPASAIREVVQPRKRAITPWQPIFPGSRRIFQLLAASEAGWLPMPVVRWMSARIYKKWLSNAFLQESITFEKDQSEMLNTYKTTVHFLRNKAKARRQQRQQKDLA